MAMNLDNQANKPLVFVGGQNGFGKSTFITSILWCLYGKLMGHVDEPFMRMIRMAGGYPAFLESSVNRTHQADGFDVELILEDVELPALSCSDLTIRRSYSKGKENLEILIDGNDYASAVGDCLWSLYRIRQAHLHADMDHRDAGQSAGVVHVRHAVE